MTHSDLYRYLLNSLKSQLEARELFTYATKYSFSDLLNIGSKPLSKAQELKVVSLIDRRKQGEPLQYLLGSWEFYSLPFYVGDGVLIPRADTETLVDVAIELIGKQKNLEIVDLCAGSGAISIAVSKTLGVWVTAVELSVNAFAYLEKNIALNDAKVTAVNMDIKDYIHEKPINILLSNPPYIEKKQLETLQAEVKREPVMALDGGEDGLDFYRNIVDRYYDMLEVGGCVIFEIGINQQEAVENILKKKGFENIMIRHDLAGVVRVIYAVK